MRIKLRSIRNYESFKQVFLKVLNEYASFKKNFAAKIVSHITKTLRKAIMRKFGFKSKYLKNRTIRSEAKYRKKRIAVANFIKRNEKNYAQTWN